METEKAMRAKVVEGRVAPPVEGAGTVVPTAAALAGISAAVAMAAAAMAMGWAASKAVARAGR